jgi:heptosyltransferase-1
MKAAMPAHEPSEGRTIAVDHEDEHARDGAIHHAQVYARAAMIPTPRRILLIKPSALGDVVHAMPIAHLLKQRWPEARLSWLIARPFADVARRHPDVDEVIVFDRRGRETGRRLFDLLLHLRDARFDLAIDLQGLLRSAAMTLATIAPTRVGFAYAREASPLAYNLRVGARPGVRHALDRYLDVTERLGCGREPVRFDFGIDEADRAHASFLARTRRVALLLPGTNWQTKRWPAERFEAVAQWLRANTDIEPLVAGAKDAEELAPAIPSARSVAGMTTIHQLAALIERADAVVTNDSGPMHIAAALNRPMVALFGPTDPIRTGPWQMGDRVVRLDLPCSPCLSRRCSHQTCMRHLDPGIVSAELRGLLGL